MQSLWEKRIMAKADRNSKEAGRKMATRMFAEIRRTNCEYSKKGAANGGKPFSIFGKWRYRGEPQDNIVARYISKATTNGDACLEGFCSALSDHVGRDGAEWPGVYGHISDREISDTRKAPAHKEIKREAGVHLTR